MTGRKITCLSCGVFKLEIEALRSQGKLKCDLSFLDSMLHMKPSTLEQEMRRCISASPEDKFLLLYGDCHPRMHEMQNQENTSRVAGINCCEILLGTVEYRKLQKAKAFIFLPEWTRRWQQIFTRELGFRKPDLAQAFMKEHRSLLVYLDTGVTPVPQESIQEISDFFQMPVEVMPISLDTLLLAINTALQKLAGDAFIDE